MNSFTKFVSWLLIIAILLSTTIPVYAQDIQPEDATNSIYLPLINGATEAAQVSDSAVNGPPGPFNKNYPGNTATNIPASIQLTWEPAAGASYYLLCYDKTPDIYCNGNDNGPFHTVYGTTYNVNLDPNTLYSWQVRAVSSDGSSTPGNGLSQWWTFTTGNYPTPFNKTYPGNGVANISTRAILTWNASTGADYYMYCVDTTHDLHCDWGDNNFKRVNGTSAVELLYPNRTYSWQVRAYNNNGTQWTPGNGSGEWWTFSTNPQGATPFNKLAPANNATDIATNVTLSWEASTNATEYRYCVDSTLNTECDMNGGNLIPVNGTSVNLTLEPNRTYEWQIHAYAAGDWVPGNGSGLWWRFTTGASGTSFGKLLPANNATNVTTKVTLKWQPLAGAQRYGYCLDAQLNGVCDRGVDNFISVTGTEVVLNLEPGATYEWQVRAYTAADQWTPADGYGQWWRFTTDPNAAAPFNKIAPANNATNIATTVTLSWQPSRNAREYGYCIDTTLDNICDQGETFTRLNATSVSLALEPGKTYQWQVRAYDANDWLAGNGSAQWWRFTTNPRGASPFGKVAPANGATNVTTNVTLSWLSSANAVEYGYCIDDTLNNGCDAGEAFTRLTGTSVAVSLAANKSYEWQIRAYAADKTTWIAGNGPGQWWRFTTEGTQLSGYTPGEFGVNEAGAANYRIPFVVPPGTAGMVPQIALTYDSRGSNTIAGWGWSLTGLSLISRCPTTVAQHGFIDGVDFDGNDQFCMDGQLLVAVNGVYGADGTVYRTENESFTKVVSVGRAGNGPLAFKAWTKAGLIIEYGYTANSRLNGSGRADVLYWAVNKITDTKSNYMLFTYDKFNATGELLPKQIEYTGNTQQSILPYDKVEFFYESRPDGRVQFIAGTPVRLSKRIQYLRVYAIDSLMREFRFGYEVIPTTGRSRLVNVTECGMNGQCLLSTRFTWSSQSTNELNFNGSGTGWWVGPGGGQNNSFVGDYNGDGRTDIAGYTGVSGQWHVCFSIGSNFDCIWPIAHARGERNTFTGDFNGDGRTDLAGFTGAGGKWEICLSQVSTFQCSLWQGHEGLMNNNIVTDFNGDGRTDIAGFSNDYIWHVCLSKGNNFECPKIRAHNGGNGNNVTADFNGDGMADLTGYTGGNSKWDVCRYTGSGFECSHWTGHSRGVSNNVTGDFNGDGLADMAGYMGSGGQWNVCLSTGINFECTVWGGHNGGSTNNVSGDFNGDGLTDMAGYAGNSQWNVCLSTGAGFTCGNRTWAGHGGGSTNNFSGDYNGDGKTDLAGYGSNGGWHITTANDPFPDQVLQFINGHGARIDVTYAPLTNPAIYTKLNDAVYPQRDFQAPLYVVANYATSNGIGGQRQISYQYKGLKVHQQGRGFLGFAAITATDSETSIKTVTQYHQVHPYKSLPFKVEQFQSNGKLLQSVENNWMVLNFNSTVQATSISEAEARARYPTVPEEPASIILPAAVISDTLPEAIVTVAEDDVTDALTVATQPKLYLPLVAAGEGRIGEETPIPDLIPVQENDYNFTNFIEFGERPLPDAVEEGESAPFLADESTIDLPMEAVAVQAASLDALAAPNAAGVTYFPYIDLTVVKKYELDGTFIQSTATSTQYDSYGNPTRIVESTNDGYIKTTANTYTNNSTRWLLGRLTVAQVTMEAPNLPSQTRTAVFAYDATSGLLISEETEPGSPLRLLKTYEYDNFGNITRSITSGPDITTRDHKTYFGFRGRFSHEAVNALGQSVKTYHEQTLGIPAIITDVNGLVTTYTYEGFGRLIEETRPDGVKTNVIYRLCSPGSCPANVVYYVRSEVGGTPPTTTYYDALDRPVRKETVSFSGQAVYVDTVYNSRGEVQRVSEPYVAGATPIWTEYTYDLLGRTLTEMRPDGSRTSTAYAGLTVQMTNALNQTSSRTVNSQGWLLRSVDAANNVVTYEYDSAGNLLKVTDPAGNTTTMEYDLRGRKITMRDPDSGLTSYRYNALGELVWQKDAKGQEVTVSYDLLGRMTQRVEPEGTSTWRYDTSPKGVGLLAEVSGPNGYKESYTYDAVSRLVKTTYTLDGQTFVMQTTYDAFSRVDKVTYPGGFKIRNKYTAQGYFKEVRNDADNALYWRADTINARGQIERATFGNNLATKQQFDANTGLLRTIQTGPTGSPSHVQNLSFTFDALGNLTSRKDTRQNLTESFRYDALNRLTSAQVTGRDAQTLQYDMLGNITFKSDVGSYSYGSNGAGPHAVTAISGGMSASFGYDANGNRTSSTGGSISYTSFNLPTTLVQGSNRITYAYGPNHERYKRTVQVSSVTTTTLMIGALYEKETVGALTTQNYYIPAAGRVVAMQVVRSNGVNNTLYLHRDHLGSLETITGPTGNVIERLSYDAWGKRRTADWRSINAAITSLVRRGYTGHEQLDEVGLIHMNGRVYDPTLGRFLSPDPFVQAPDFSQSLNRYSYVLNNPLSLTDPSGFNWFSDAWKGIKDFFEDNWKTIVVAAVTIATMIWAPGISTGLWATIFKGAMAGFAGSVTSSMLYGGSLSDALQAGARGALIGGITAGAFFGVGKIFGHQAAFASATHVKKIIAHGIVGGASEMLQGGKFAHGFLSGAFTQAFAPGIDLIDKSNSGINSYRTIAAAIVGGTAAEIGGGKFANGAITGAFSRMYNDDGAEWEARRYFGQAANSNAAALQQFGSSLVKIPVEIGTRIIHLGAAYSELLLSGINFVGMSATSAAGLPLAEAAEVLQPLLMAHPSTANFARSIEVWQPLLDSVGKLDFSNLTDTYHANSKYHWQQYQAHANCAFGPSCGW